MRRPEVTLADQLAFARNGRDYWAGVSSVDEHSSAMAVSMSDTWIALVNSLEEFELLRELCDRQSRLLTGVVNAIKGEPPPDTLWSHHDAPDLASKLKRWAAVMEDSRNFWQQIANERGAEIARLLELK